MKRGEPNYPVTDVVGLMTSGLACKLEGAARENTGGVMDGYQKKESNLVFKHLRVFCGPGSGRPPHSEGVRVNLLSREPPCFCN